MEGTLIGIGILILVMIIEMGITKYMNGGR